MKLSHHGVEKRWSILWLEEEGKDEKAVIAYRSVLNQFQEWLHGSDTSITDVKPIIIKEYQSYMRHNLNRPQATINKATAGLKTFYAWLADRGAINDNHMTRIKIQKVQSSDKINMNPLKQLRYMLILHMLKW